MEHTVDEIREIIGSDSEMAKKINSMPYTLQLYMKTGISKILIPRPLFLEWYYTHCFYRK